MRYSDIPSTGTIAVLGATGYLGGRLVEDLLRRGLPVRAIARSAEKMRQRPCAASPHLEIVAADACREEELTRALARCSVCYWLMSRTGSSREPGSDMVAAARNLLHASRVLDLARIIYLGPPQPAVPSGSAADRGTTLDPGWILSSGSVPVTWLRAAMIVGSGSVSFEILRHLTDRLPVMAAPQWVQKPIQPIAVGDVIRILSDCLDAKDTLGMSSEIGGPDILSFRDLMDLYAEAAEIPKRAVIPVPWVAKGASAYWINLMTPVPFHVARRMVESIEAGSVGFDDRIQRLIPFLRTRICDAVKTALHKTRCHEIDSCWSDAGGLTPPEWLTCGDAGFAGGEVLDCSYRMVLDCPPEKVWKLIASVGGGHGWFFGAVLWRLRGLFDRLLGGVGLSRGRRSVQELRVGDAVDFWRVLLAEENRRLILLAEMKIPGEAVLQFSLNSHGSGCELIQIARFRPAGLPGWLYWYAMIPFHDYLFKGMLSAIAREGGCAILEDPEPFEGGEQACRLPEDWGQID